MNSELQQTCGNAGFAWLSIDLMHIGYITITAEFQRQREKAGLCQLPFEHLLQISQQSLHKLFIAMRLSQQGDGN